MAILIAIDAFLGAIAAIEEWAAMFVFGWAREAMLSVVVFAAADGAAKGGRGKFAAIYIVRDSPAPTTLFQGRGISGDDKFTSFCKHVDRGFVN